MFVVEKNPKSVAAEAYRTLKTNIQYSSVDKKYKSIVVTSANPGEGKSTTAGNLALTLAEGEAKVLLIDCDMRKPSIHKNFKMTNNYGISEILVQNKKVMDVAHKYNNNLHIITTGKIPPNPSEMLASKAMTLFLEEMKEHFDYVILDTPPLQAVADPQILSTKVDGTLVVVRSGKTKKDDVNNSISLLNKVNADVIGTVLHAVDKSKNKYYYYYGENK